MMVIFKSLEPESIIERWKRAWRGKETRDYENVELTLNMRTMVIKRGVIVNIGSDFLEVADSVPGDLARFFEYERVV